MASHLLAGHIRTKVASNDCVPGGVVLLVELLEEPNNSQGRQSKVSFMGAILSGDIDHRLCSVLLDEGGNVLLYVVLLQGLTVKACDEFMATPLGHMRGLRNTPETHQDS